MFNVLQMDWKSVIKICYDHSFFRFLQNDFAIKTSANDGGPGPTCSNIC